MLSDGRSLIVKKEIKLLLPSITLGTVLGAVILTKIPAEVLGLVFAILILLAVILTLFIKGLKLTPKVLISGGFSAGLMGTTSGIHGAALAVLYQNEDIRKTRATLALVFIFAYSISLVALAYTGGFNLNLAIDGLFLLPGLLLGFIFAKHLRGLLSQTMARSLMLGIAFISAVILLSKSI